jgi:DUF4097 and DUF4098 domain-containing protein YvlB
MLSVFVRRAVAALLVTGLVSPAMAEEFTKQFSVTGRPKVQVRLDDGSVQVITSDSDQVEFRVKFEGYTLDRNLFLQTRQEGNEVELTARVKHGVSLGLPVKRLHAEIHMPKNADLRIRTGDGDIDVSDVNGEVHLQSGDGKIRATRIDGELDLHTGDGAITADALKGTVKLRTGDGSIDASNIDGKCEAMTGDGGIRLSGRFDGLDLRSGDGSVTARAEPGSTLTNTWSIRTGDGPIDLGIPHDFKANLDVSTSDGHVTLGLPVTVEGQVSRSRISGTINGGGPALRVHSGDGPIRLGTS